jgi:superfamily I DNA and/or RNA helicase
MQRIYVYARCVGAECEVIILTCCRTETLGFAVSPQRLNVALTRARRHLIIVGKAALLRTNPLWNTVVQAAEVVSA